MEIEISQLGRLGTYTVVELPEGRKAVDCRWVYLIKRNSDGSVSKYKARLVAKGFSQVPGQDFFDTHAPVMRLESFRAVLAIGAVLDMEIHQVDVVGAYLNSDLNEEIYMKQPPGFDDGTGRVWRLHKALYGLKQAGRAWNEKLNKVLVNDLKFTRCQADPCVYIRRSGDILTIIIVHVDDMAILASSTSAMTHIKEELRPYFPTTDIGEITTFVGIQVVRDRQKRTITIHQHRYIQTVLERFHMELSHPSSHR